MAHKLPPVLERGLRGMGMEMKEKAYSKKKVVKSIWDMDETNSAAAASAPSIPDDLKCPICGDLFKDCIMMPICACSVCDKCASAALTEAKNNNKNNTCPACGTPDNSPEDLIPCRKVRLKVNEFKRKNGSSRVVNNSKIKVEPGITVKRELGTGSFTESNGDTAREVDFIDGFKFVSFTNFENLASDTHDAQQSESAVSCKEEETPRFTVDISDGKFQVNWRSLASDTENNNNNNNKGRRNERYKVTWPTNSVANQLSWLPTRRTMTRPNLPFSGRITRARVAADAADVSVGSTSSLTSIP